MLAKHAGKGDYVAARESAFIIALQLCYFDFISVTSQIQIRNNTITLQIRNWKNRPESNSAYVVVLRSLRETSGCVVDDM